MVNMFHSEAAKATSRTKNSRIITALFHQSNNPKRIAQATRKLWFLIGMIIGTLYVATSLILFHRAHSLDMNAVPRMPVHVSLRGKAAPYNDVILPNDDDSQRKITDRNVSLPKISLLSRNATIKVTSDVRGNLGPASVIIQDPPGTNWLKDRWQAASDMHGTAIAGSHWVILDFGGLNMNIHPAKVVLDWESAHATEYRIEGGYYISSGESENKEEDDASNVHWEVLFDANNPRHIPHRSVAKSGQSPGVKFPMPLHIVHTLDLYDCCYAYQRARTTQSYRYLRVFIIKPAKYGWGVSLWQVDVYGSVDL